MHYPVWSSYSVLENFKNFRPNIWAPILIQVYKNMSRYDISSIINIEIKITDNINIIRDLSRKLFWVVIHYAADWVTNAAWVHGKLWASW